MSCFFKRDPKEEDKLSPTAFEELVEEMIKGFQDSDVTKDPFMSPLLAPDEMLSGLPPIHIVVSILKFLVSLLGCKSACKQV